MADDANVSKVIDALVKALAFARDNGSQKVGVDDAPGPFKYAFCCGEAGGIAAAASIFGVKALELCDDISDALEDNDADLLGHIVEDLKERTDVGAASNSGSHSIG